MIEHIVLFRWKPEATPEQVAETMEGLRGRKDRISGILSLTCGADFSGRAQGYTRPGRPPRGPGGARRLRPAPRPPRRR